MSLIPDKIFQKWAEENKIDPLGADVYFIYCEGRNEGFQLGKNSSSQKIITADEAKREKREYLIAHAPITFQDAIQSLKELDGLESFGALLIFSRLAHMRASYADIQLQENEK